MGGRTRVVAALLAALVCGGLAACAKALPPEKSAYAGDWVAPDMALHIGMDGRVEYERRSGSTTTRVSAPIKAFEGNDFVVGIAFVSTKFVVTRAPYRVAGHWKMVVDGVELTKIGNGGTLDHGQSDPQTSI